MDRHSLQFHKCGRDGSGKCDAFFTGEVGDQVHGALFLLTEDQFDRLDDFEGVGYERKPLVVQTSAGERDAYAYIALPTVISRRLRPFDWYLGLVLRGARDHVLPDWYCERIASTEVIVDSDEARSQWHLDLLGGTE